MTAAAADAAVADPKRRATLAARLALAGGFELIDQPDGTYVCQRWSSWASCHCANLDEVEAFAQRVERMGPPR